MRQAKGGADMEALTSREQELEYCLREVLGMIERNELVRNTLADGMPDWYARMFKMVSVLKRTQDVLEAAGQAKGGGGDG